MATRNFPCETCGTTEPHRQLSKGEQQQLVGIAGAKHPGEYWMCMGANGSCRTLRTGFNQRPFGGGPRKLP
ncbi:hypothetical protein ACIBL6_05230 [Streptomyces sp. NPDC050400]|uniref:hypothetical protein n=1 Tax=unclassified Streptomyces TaxID=2593676 RepID=UPI003555EB2F